MLKARIYADASPSDAHALNRLAFGPDPASLAEIHRSGLAGWVERQLHPDAAADQACEARVAALRLPIRYPAGPDWPAADELRPVQWLDAPIEQLWALNDRDKPGPEKARPRVEVAAATLVRAVYSRWQLREVLCDFWHNHFNVNAFEPPVGIALPVYDREVIRRHCLGNFRRMLEAVSTSAAMLWYLDNRTSRAGAPNENYGREMFELHTLGRDAYLNGLYSRWRDVPGALAGRPAGYIDEDVYEAARAFTGWGLEDGTGLGGGVRLPNTGRFAYVESRHDNYQKRVLATDFDPYRPPMADGRQVLDLAAFHPATARFLAKKLCIRLVADEPPESLVASTVRVWHESRDKPDQIARAVRHIALSREFARSRGAKVKRPLELAAGFVRATGIDFTPGEGLIRQLDLAGQRLFGWPSPDGHPDRNEAWLGTGTMRSRWTLAAGLADDWWHNGAFDALMPFAERGVEAGRFVAHWIGRMFPEPPPRLVPALLDAAGLAPQQRLDNPVLARRIVAWAAMAPEYQLR